MSYRIEYTGSLVDNRNLPQITANSSLVRFVTTYSYGTITNFSLPLSATGVYVSDADVSYFSSGGTNQRRLYFSFADPGDFGVIFMSLSPGETKRIVITPVTVGNELSVTWGYLDSNANFVSIDGSFGPGHPFTSESNTFSISLTRSYLGGAVGYGFKVESTQNNLTAEWTDYPPHSRVEEESTISVSVSTFQEGQQKTGGTLITNTVQTQQNGRPQSSAPASEFGLVAFNNSKVVADAKQLPAASGVENTYMDVTDEAYFTAETDTLVVNAVGTTFEHIVDPDSVVLIEDDTEREAL